jgi:predicted ATPase
MRGLCAALEQACGGYGRLVLISGEPGIGKTTTCEHLARHAQQQGVGVLWGRCYEGQGAPAFWPWIQLIRAYLRTCNRTQLEALKRGEVASVAEIVPDLRRAVPDLPSAPPLSPEQARSRLSDSVTSFFKNAAREQTLVLIVEDLQGADASSLMLLQHFAREIGDVRLLVLATYREAPTEGQPSLTECMAELARTPVVLSVPLRGLSEVEVQSFVESAIGRQPAALIKEIYDRSGGNPLYLNEVVRGLSSKAASGINGHPIPAIPPSLSYAISARLRELSEPSRRLLARASVIGREFNAALVGAALDTSPTLAAECLSEAVASQVVAEVAGSDKRYRFCHALIQETLYEQLPPEERAQLHRKVGEALAKMEDADDHLAEMAHHFFEANLPSGQAKAVSFARRAADRAVALLAYEEAVRLYQLALHAQTRLPDSDQRERSELLLAHAEAQRNASYLEASKQSALEAAAIARRLGERDLLSRSALAYGGELAWGERGQTDETKIALIEEALQQWNGEDHHLHVRLLARLGLALVYESDRKRRERLCREAIEMARRLDDPTALAVALYSTHAAVWDADNSEERLIMASEMVQLAERAGDRHLAFQAHYWRACDAFDLGDTEEVESEITACADLFDVLQQPFHYWHVGCLRSTRAIIVGPPEEAWKLREQTLAYARWHETAALWVATLQAFWLGVLQGDLDQGLLAPVQFGVAEHAEVPSLRAMLSHTYAELGMLEEARVELERLAKDGFARLRRDQNFLMHLTHLTYTCAAVGDEQVARMLYDLLLPHDSRILVVAHGVAFYGCVAHYLGTLAALLEMWDAAARHFEDALATYAHMGARPWTVRVQLEYAHLLKKRGGEGDCEKAAELTAAAVAMARELGMERWAEKIQYGMRSAEPPEFAMRNVEPPEFGMRNAECGIEGKSEIRIPKSEIPDQSEIRSPPSEIRPFVGRDNEMRRLREAFEQARTERGRLVLISGEPGIGKTATCEQLAASVHSHGARVLWGRCYESEGAPAFWPWVQVLRSLVRDLDPNELRAVAETDGDALFTLVPEIRDRFPDLTFHPLGDSAEARFRLFDGVSRLLERAAAARPLVVIVDDLHGADRSSLLLLEFVAREMRRIRCLIVGTYRDAATTGEHPIEEALVELGREPGTERVTLRGLSKAEVTHYVELVAGRAAPALAHAIHERTEGNPLYLTEMVRVLAAEGRLDPGDGNGCLPLPRNLRNVVRRRLKPLSESCKQLLSFASIMGREFRSDLLQRVLAHAGDRSGPNEVARLLEEAVSAGLLGFTPDTRRYRFSHALIRETLYDETEPSLRAERHRRVGEVLEQLPDSDAVLAELAYHFSEAEGREENAKAIYYARRAGDRAVALLAYEEAARLYELALEALERDPVIDQRKRCELLLSLAEAHNKAGAPDAVKRAILAAAEIARRLGRREPFSRAALLYGVELAWGEAPVADRTQIGLLREAMAQWKGTESALHARLLARLAQALLFEDAGQERTEFSERAVEMARRAGDPLALARALVARHVVCWGLDKADERLQMATEVAQLGEAVGDIAISFQGHIWRLGDALELGDRTTATAEIEICAALAEQLRQPLWTWHAALSRSVRPQLDGRFEEADRLAQDAFEIGQSRLTIAAPGFVFWLGRLAAATACDEPEKVLDAFRESADRYPMVPAFRCVVAYLYGALGREAEARREIERLTAAGFNMPRDVNWIPGVAYLADTCSYLRDASPAEALYELLLPYREQAVVYGFGLYVGPVSERLAKLAVTLSRWEDAAAHFEAALEMNARMCARPWLARTQYEYASMLVERNWPGDHERASTLAREALATAQELGMVRLVERLKSAVRDAECEVRGAECEGRGAEDEGKSEIRNPKSEISEGVFRREAEFWTLAYAGTVSRFKDAKGLRYIAHLLKHAGQEMHVLDLAAQFSAEEPESPNFARALRQQGSGEPVLDAKAKGEYKQRLEELFSELEEAERFHDCERCARVRAEIEFIEDQLAAAVGLGGRGRRASAEAQRARLAVTNRIRETLRRIKAANSALAHHLSGALKTGYFCSYKPDPEHPIRWAL